jgi:hypothetical protein
MDIWVATNPQNAEKLVEVLKTFGFDLPEVTPELFQEEEKVIRMGLPPIRIELITSISGVAFDQCYPHRIDDVIDDVEVKLIDLEHLKINKRASGRHKDLNDLEHLP